MKKDDGGWNDEMRSSEVDYEGLAITPEEEEVMNMANCIICKEQVDWTLVVEEFEEMLRQADALGMESLTEQEQVVCEGLVCSYDCYEEVE